MLFAGNAPRFYVSRGADFGSFKRDCSRPVLESADRRTPESYENREWISAVYREGNRWHALISNEFHDAVASTCQPGDPSAGQPLLVQLGHATRCPRTAPDTFSKPLAPAHVVAPPPYVWVPPLPGASPNAGWASSSRVTSRRRTIVRKDDGYFYGVVGLIPSKANPPTYETCLIRTDRLDDPTSWRAWDGSGFNLRMTSPYVTGSPSPHLQVEPRCARSQYHLQHVPRSLHGGGQLSANDRREAILRGVLLAVSRSSIGVPSS